MPSCCLPQSTVPPKHSNIRLTYEYPGFHRNISKEALKSDLSSQKKRRAVRIGLHDGRVLKPSPFSYEGCFIGRGKLSGSVRRAICEEVKRRGGERTDRFQKGWGGREPTLSFWWTCSVTFLVAKTLVCGNSRLSDQLAGEKYYEHRCAVWGTVQRQEFWNEILAHFEELSKLQTGL